MRAFHCLCDTAMSLNRVSSGRNLPDDFNVIIEIPAHGEPIKYEVDKESGAMFVDRFMSTAMHYPSQYGYIRTPVEDGDPSTAGDTPIPLIPGW
jgi:inorganic pyrophosphatase